MEYTDTFKARMVRRMLGPSAVSANALEQEVGVPHPTLSRWLRETATFAAMEKKDKQPAAAANPKRAQDWTPEEKLREVDEKDLIANAEKSVPLTKRALAADKIVVNEDLSALFGVEMASDAGSPDVVVPEVAPGGRRSVRSVVKVAAKPPIKKKAKKAPSSRSPSRVSGQARVRNRRGQTAR